MDEYYVEQIVEKTPTFFSKSIKVVIWIVAALLFVLGLFMFGFVAILLAVLVGVIGVIISPYLNVEYEYLYLCRELSVDRIFNKERRKKAANFALDKMEIMAPKDSHSLDSYLGRVAKSYDFTSGTAEARVYVIILNDNGIKSVLFEPDAAMLKAIKDNFPRKVAE